MASTRGRSSSRGYLDKIDGKPSKSSSWRKTCWSTPWPPKAGRGDGAPRPGRGGLWSPAAGDSHLPGAVRATPSSGSCTSARGKVAVHTPYLRRILDNLLLQHFKICQPQGAYPGAGPRRGKHAGAVFPQQPKGTGRRHRGEPAWGSPAYRL